MNYLRPHKKGKVSLIFLVVLLVVAVVIVFRPSPPNILTQALHSLGVPLWRVQSMFSVTVRDITSIFQTKNALVERNQTLERELGRLQLRLLAFSLLEKENELLKESLGRRDEDDTILAAVLLRPNASPYDTFIIDVGEKLGAAAGDLVLVEDVVLGRVTDVYTRTSVVTLFSSPDEETEVIIGPSHIQATAKGLGGGNFKVVLPRGIDVKERDAVTMPGINPLFFGITEEIIAKPADSFQMILFKNPVNMSEVYFVEIVRR